MNTDNVLVPRQEELLKLLNSDNRLSNTDLATKLAVSSQTIRRDLNKLAKLGFISRFHGGATINENIPNDSIFNQGRKIYPREVAYKVEKLKIAKKVAELIPDGSSVFITIGSTVEKIAHELINKNLFVITDSLRVAEILYDQENTKVVLPSGIVNAANGGIEGPKTISDLSEYQVDFLITSVGGIYSDGTLLEFTQNAVMATKTMMQNAKNIIVACDHSKFTTSAPLKLATTKDINYLVTDMIPSENMKEILEHDNVNIVIAK